MVFKLKTSRETMQIFSNIGTVTHLQPFVLAKIAIALSIRYSDEDLTDRDFETDNDGLELNRQTITGEYDDLFKALIIDWHLKNIPDEEYFPKYLKAHLDRGAKLLRSEFKYANGNFYQHLLNIDKGI